jgi:rhamnosyltransferase
MHLAYKPCDTYAIEEDMKQTHEKIAIIMRSFNDADVIQGTLEALSNQTIRQFELWNFDSTSTDGTLEIIRKFNNPDRIRLNDSANYNPGRILNEAVATVDADILVFLNSDATPQNKYWLERLIEPLIDPTVGAVFGRQIARPNCRKLFVKDTERAFGDGSESARWAHFFSMANSAARKTVLERFPFETAIGYSEDIEWSYRIRRNGYRVRYTADSIAMHSHNYTLKQSYKRHYGEGKADAFIFREGELNYSWMRYFLLPFGMEFLRDMRWAAAHHSLDAVLHSIPLRFCQKWARWRGQRAGAKQLSRTSSLPVACSNRYTHGGNSEVEARIAMDQSLIKIYVKDAVPKQNFLALVLMGGYGRGEGGYCLIDGKPAPYNDYDYFLVVKDMGRKEAAALQASLHKVALRLSHIVGVEVDLAVLRQESLASAPFSLMNAEMKWGHRVVLGDPRVLEIMPAMPIDKLSLGEFTRLMNNRGALLLMNIMALDSKRTLEGKDLEEFFKYLFKAILACGDALLARNGTYHPSYVEKQERLKLLKSLPCPEFLKLYKLAVEQKFYPNPDLYQNQDLEDWQTRVTNCWLTTLSILEAHRTRRSISDWKEYARPRLHKGQLENAQVWRNIAITFRDFGMRHTLRYLDWARRYPRERLISVLPLLLARNQQAVAKNISIPLNIPLGTDWSATAEGYLSTWKRYA